MTSHPTIIVLSHTSPYYHHQQQHYHSRPKVSELGSAVDMPSVTPTDPPLSVLSNSTNLAYRNPTSIDGPRKSNEKTISGVFAYTNGTDVETGLPDHRLEQFRGLQSNSLHSLGTSTAPEVNGSPTVPNGILKGGANGVTTRNRSHSKAGSTRSIGSLGTADRTFDQSRVGSTLSQYQQAVYADSQTRRSHMEAPERLSSSSHANVDVSDPTKLRNNNSNNAPSLLQGPGSYTALTQAGESSKVDGQSLLPPNTRTHPTAHRFSSPPAPTEALLQDPPRLVQRHTLQIPRSSSAMTRDSRDYSFAAGEEGHTTGRFSPSRDSADVNFPRHRRTSLNMVRRNTRSMVSDAHLDEIPPDEDAARWTEIVKQKRASRRKKKEEEEDDDRVIVGKKVEEGHVNWVTAYNMLTGIRFTVSRTNAKMDRELTDADFDARHKFSFDVTGNELTPSAKYDFKFKDYSPWVFRKLRAHFGLDPADYLMSLTSKYILSELGSPGKSGSFFYFSRDYKYIIKTIHHAEHKLLRRILRDYYAHVRDNPNTLISQFYGLHRVKIPYGRKIHFVVMNNLFPPHRDIHQTFDLKGSTVGRDFKEDDLEANPRATLKDLNWLRRDLHLEFQSQIKQAFVEQITRDVRLLQKLHIMDYSLLVGMHDLEKGNEENVRETTLKVFQPGGERDDGDVDPAQLLVRTPSRLENARKARELRQTLKKEKPTPMSLVQAKMPDQMKPTDMRNYRLFYSDDGGVRATHEDGTGGEQVYYLGVIDCLTHYGFVKRIEHFWKGLSSPRDQISPIPPEAYGERFINFITGVTMTKEEADRRKTLDEEERGSVDAHNVLHHHHIPAPISTLDGTATNEKITASPVSPGAVDITMAKAQKQADKSTGGKDRRTSENEVPDRALRTVSVPDGDGSASRNSTTLPVVQEVGEHSDISRSTSKEKHTATDSRRSDSHTELTEPSVEQRSRADSGHVGDTMDEKHHSLHSRGPSNPDFSEEARDQVNAAFKPIPSYTDSSQTYSARDKPPRLGSGLIPHLTPMLADYDSANGLDFGRN